MSFRNVLGQALNALFWRVDIARTSLDDDNEVAFEIGTEDGAEEDQVPAEPWGTAGFASRPLDGNATIGYAKALRVQRGEDIITIATHDPRHLEVIEPGEVVVHALGKDGAQRALIRLKPDGSIDIQGTTINVSADVVNVAGSSDAAALASKVDSLSHAVATHTHPETGGTTQVSAALSGFGGTYTTASTKLKIGG